MPAGQPSAGQGWRGLFDQGYARVMADRYPLEDRQIYGSDVDDDDMDAILEAMSRLDDQPEVGVDLTQRNRGAARD